MCSLCGFMESVGVWLVWSCEWCGYLWVMVLVVMDVDMWRVGMWGWVYGLCGCIGYIYGFCIIMIS